MRLRQQQENYKLHVYIFHNTVYFHDLLSLARISGGFPGGGGGVCLSMQVGGEGAEGNVIN